MYNSPLSNYPVIRDLLTLNSKLVTHLERK